MSKEEPYGQGAQKGCPGSHRPGIDGDVGDRARVDGRPRVRPRQPRRRRRQLRPAGRQVPPARPDDDDARLQVRRVAPLAVLATAAVLGVPLLSGAARLPSSCTKVQGTVTCSTFSGPGNNQAGVGTTTTTN